MSGTVTLEKVQDRPRQDFENIFGRKLNGGGKQLHGDKGEFFVPSMLDEHESDKDQVTGLDDAQKKLESARKAANALFTKLVRCSDGTQSLEDFRKMPPKERIEKANALVSALTEVAGIRTDFSNVERGVAAKQKGMDPTSQEFKPWNDVRLAAASGLGLLREALPPRYEAVEAKWDDTLKTRLKPFTLDDQERAVALNDAKGKTQEVSDAAKSLKEATQGSQTRSWDRVSLFRDAGQNSVGITPEEMEKGRKAIDEITKRGMDILDHGGTFKDVDELMSGAGLTKEMWPPQLVSAVQAWRKTTRGLQTERVRKMSETSSELPSKDNVNTLLEWMGNYTGLDDSSRQVNQDTDPKSKVGLFDAGKDGNAISEGVTKWMGGAVTGLKGVSTVHDLFKNMKTLVEDAKKEQGGVERLLGIFENSLKTLKTAGSGAKGGLDMANTFGSEALQKQLKTVIPGLGVAIAGTEFLLAAKDLYAAVKSSGRSKGLQTEGTVSFLYDEAEEAMLGVLANDLGAQRTKVAKNSVNMVTKTLDVAGSGAQFGGPHGQLAAAGLSIASSGISLGAKAIFTGISWSAAKKARKMVYEAQQGNMDAQVEVFEKSGFYAKMYLAILAKEKNPLAVRYLVDQGIEEGDLDGPTGVEVLRDAMMTSVGQENDQDVDSDMLPKLKKVLKTIGSVVDAPAEITLHIATSTYVPGTPAIAFDDKPGNWAKQWEEGKKALMSAGLINTSTGIGGALAKVAKAAGEVKQPATKDTLMAAIYALNGAVETTLSCSPQAFDPKSVMTRVPHEPCRSSLAALRTVLNVQIEAYWTEIYSLAGTGQGGIWAYTAKPALDLPTWNTFWSDGTTKAAFPKDPVTTALDNALQKKTAFETAADGTAKRKPATEYLASLDALDDKLSEALELEAVSRQKSALDFIAGFIRLGNAQRQAVDEVLADANNKADIDGAGEKFDDLSTAGAGWSKIWNSAVSKELTADSDGKVVKEDAGFGKAVDAVQKAWNGFETAKADAAKTPPDKKALQARLKAHRTLEIEAGKLLKAQLEFARLHRYSVLPLLAATARLAQQVQSTLQKGQSEINELRANAGFEPGKKDAGNKLSSANWRATYESAVDNGAVLESGTAKDGISDALKEIKKAKKAYDAAVKKKVAKLIRKTADELHEAYQDGLDAVGYVKGYKNYVKNAKMEKELQSITDKIKMEMGDTELVKARNGSNAPAQLNLAYKTVSNEDWQSNKKKAVAAGIVADKDTGIKNALKAYADAIGEATKKEKDATGKGPQSKEALAVATAKGGQTRAAELVKSLLDKLKNEHVEWNQYIESFSGALV